MQPGGEGRRPHLVHTGHPDAVVGVTPQTGQNLKVRRNHDLLLREVPPPDRTPRQLRSSRSRRRRRRRLLSFSIRPLECVCVCVCVSVCVCVCVTWRMQVDSSECPMNPGFHDNVTLSSTILRTCSSIGAAGNTERKRAPPPESYHPITAQQQFQLVPAGASVFGAASSIMSC